MGGLTATTESNQSNSLIKPAGNIRFFPAVEHFVTVEGAGEPLRFKRAARTGARTHKWKTQSGKARNRPVYDLFIPHGASRTAGGPGRRLTTRRVNSCRGKFKALNSVHHLTRNGCHQMVSWRSDAVKPGGGVGL